MGCKFVEPDALHAIARTYVESGIAQVDRSEIGWSIAAALGGCVQSDRSEVGWSMGRENPQQRAEDELSDEKLRRINEIMLTMEAEDK